MLKFLLFTMTVLCHTILTVAAVEASTVSKPKHYYVFVPEAAEMAVHDLAFLMVRAVYYDMMKAGDRITVYSGETPQERASLTIPTSRQLTTRLKERFYDRQSFNGDLRQAMLSTATQYKDRNLNVPHIATVLATRIQTDNQFQPIVMLLGSPLHHIRDNNPDQRFFDMGGNKYPNDDTLLYEGSPYSTLWANQMRALEGIPVHHIFLKSAPFANNYHREKMHRFWSLFWERIGANLVTFSEDQQSYKRISDLNLMPRNYQISPEGKFVMRFGVPFGPSTKLLEGRGTTATIPISALQHAGLMELALTWTDATDLDLRVKHVPSNSIVYFKNRNVGIPNNGAMSFWQDRDNDLVQNKFGWEYVKISGAKLNPHDFIVSVNVFGTAKKPSATVPFELRIKVGERHRVLDRLKIQGIYADRGEEPNSKAWISFTLAELMTSQNVASRQTGTK